MQVDVGVAVRLEKGVIELAHRADAGRLTGEAVELLIRSAGPQRHEAEASVQQSFDDCRQSRD